MPNVRFLCSPGVPGPTSDAPAYYRTSPVTAPTAVAGGAGVIADIVDNSLAVGDMQSQRWLQIAPSGTTAQRPPPSSATGQFFIDTTVAKPIFSDGTSWRDPMTGSTV